MKAKNKITIDQIFLILNDINTMYPNQGIMRHIVDATADYKKNLWMLGNDELLFALNKYKAELEMSVADDKEVEKIIKEASNLDTILHEEDSDIFNVDERENWIN